MSDPLVSVFQENLQPGEGCASPEEIFRAVAGLEGQARTAALVDHTIRCGDCARLWRLAREAQAESAPALAAEVTPLRPPRSWRWGAAAGAGLALAASLLLVLRRPPVENPERGSPERRITSGGSPARPRGRCPATDSFCNGPRKARVSGTGSR
jgi:hypothetical protein